MDIAQVRSLLHLGRDGAAAVDICTVGGMVRTVSIIRGPKVLVEFENWGYDQGGAAFVKPFPSLELAIEEVETFLNRSIADWNNVNLNGSYPQKPTESSDGFIFDINQGTVELPSDGFLPANTWTTREWRTKVEKLDS